MADEEEELAVYLDRVVHPVVQPLLSQAAQERPEDFHSWLTGGGNTQQVPQIQIGASIPDTEVYRGHTRNPEKVKLSDMFKGKTGVLFAVVGAFTKG